MVKYPYPTKIDKLYHSDLIVEIVKLTNCNTYLELGVQHAKGFNRIHDIVDKAVGVDRDSCANKPGTIFHKMTTDVFFGQNKDTFDIIFIDADHSFEQVKKDFDNSLKILNKYGIIILHDTDPSEEKYQSNSFCGDCYKIIDHVRENYKDLDILTLPIIQTGLTLVREKGNLRA
jgi:hypothetical protein